MPVRRLPALATGAGFAGADLRVDVETADVDCMLSVATRGADVIVRKPD